MSDNNKTTYTTMSNDATISQSDAQQKIIVNIWSGNGTCMEAGTEFVVRIHLQEAVYCSNTGIVVWYTLSAFWVRFIFLIRIRFDSKRNVE